MTSTSCKLFAENYISYLLAVTEVQRGALKAAQNAIDEYDYTGTKEMSDKYILAERLYDEALAITPESVELVEFACTLERDDNRLNTINDYALYNREDAEMHCRGEFANGFRIVPLYKIKQKG